MRSATQTAAVSTRRRVEKGWHEDCHNWDDHIHDESRPASAVAVMTDFPFDVTDRWTRTWRTRHWDGATEIPSRWASAVAAVENDLSCWTRKKPLPDFTDHEWDVLVVDSDNVLFQLRQRDSTGWGGYFMTDNPLEADRPAANCIVFLADEVQGNLTGYHRIDWPSAGWDVLDPRVVDGTAMWCRTRDGTPIARVGALCTDCTTGW